MKKTFPELIYIIVGLLVMLVGSTAYLTGIIESKDLVVPLLSLVATFCGALFAFRLNQAKEDSKLHTTRKEALNRACFALARQANAIRQLKDYFEEIPQPIFRALQTPALKTGKYESLVLNVSELDFLLETEHREILFRLALEFERFHSAIDAVNLRSEFHVTEYGPKLADVGLNRRPATGEEFEKLLGERIFGTIVNMTETALQNLRASDASIRLMADDLIKAAKSIYPDSKFTNFKLPDSELAAAKVADEQQRWKG